MSIENKLNAIARYLAAQNEEERQRARTAMLEEIHDTPEAAELECKPYPDAKSVIIAALLELGVPCHIRGYSYLICAIGAVVEKPELMYAVTCTLYPLVADICHTTGCRVERGIRHAIECGWDRCDLETMQSYFGNTISTRRCKPTNSEFIARVACVARQRMQEVG